LISSWPDYAIRALQLARGYDLDVTLVSYGESPARFRRVEEEFNTGT
jgi:hypothetical protein